MLDEIRKIPAFVVRDFQLLFTYKLALSMELLNIVFNLFYFVLFGSLFASSSVPSLSEYGGNFISYLLVGSIGWGFLWSIMHATSTSLSLEMVMGPLESILITPTRLTTMIISYAVYGCFYGLITIAILMAVGFFLFGITVFGTASIYTIIIFALSIIMMTGFGMIFGGLTIWLKNIGQTIPLIQNIAMLFSAVYFPIVVLPGFLQPVAYFSPFYYSVEGLRKSLIPATQTSEITFYIIVLIFFTIASLVLGVFMLHRGLIKAKKDGSLAFY
jgi:ABC-2 type transport system permease protein